MSEMIQKDNNDTALKLHEEIISEEQTNIQKNNKLTTALKCFLLCAVLFACGFFSMRYALSIDLFNINSEEKVSYIMHAYDGEVEVFDGSAWVSVGNAQVLASLDPFYETYILNSKKAEAPVVYTPMRMNGVVVVSPRRTYRPSQGNSTPVVSEPEWTDDYL